MKRILYLAMFVLIFTSVTSVSYAQKSSGEGSGTGSGSDQGNQVQNQNKVNTQNQGEDSQLKVNTQNKEASQFGSDSGARQQMANVSNAVENFLVAGNKVGGVGKQVSDIATQQKGAQSQIGKTLDEIEEKKGLAKKLFGPDYGAIKEMKQLMQQNKVRIQQLQQLQNQTQNQGEETQLQEMIQAMTEQNTALQSQVQTEESVKSMFGWLVKLFN